MQSMKIWTSGIFNLLAIFQAMFEPIDLSISYTINYFGLLKSDIKGIFIVLAPIIPLIPIYL